MRYFFLIILSALTALILWINLALHPLEHTRAEQKENIRLQLNFLEVELKQKNLGQRMQYLFPEGYVFIHALYGLSWCELALADSSRNNQNIKAKAVEEALYAFNRIDSEEGVTNFQLELIPENGIFYCGWKNYLLSKILQIDYTFKDRLVYETLFKKQSKEIVKALKLSKSPYLDSYNGHAWPADMFVAMASICNYNKLYTPKYTSDIDSWLIKVKRKLDPETKMIPHKVHSETGNTIEGARGCSIGLSLRMLAEIDPVFGKQQYNLARTNFITTRFGLPAVREYPKGTDGLGDVDSGPVILGVGFSGTIVMIGTMSIYDNTAGANQQYKTIHAFGFETKYNSEKKYLFGILPMADAFISWGRATDLHYNSSKTNIMLNNWSFRFHCISICILFIIWLPVYFKFLKNYFKPLKQ
jgi:hypothetical protein